MVFGQYLSGDDLAIAVNKVGSISLLEGDARSGTRAFPHTEIMDYFLSLAYVELVPSGEYPKAIRRGIIGRDFLGTFNEVLGAVQKGLVRDFCAAAQEVLERRLLDGRGGRNMAALLLAAVDQDEASEQGFRIASQHVDEAVLSGSLPLGVLSSVEISTLDVRGTDLSALKFVNCVVDNLIADRTTKLPLGFPRPGQLSLDEDGTLSELDNDGVSAWIESRVVSIDEKSKEGVHCALFERICRAMTRQFWIRSNGDDPAARLVAKDEWREIRAILEEEGAIKIRKNVPVGGPRSDFYRVERAAEFLNPTSTDPVVRRVWDRLEDLDQRM